MFRYNLNFNFIFNILGLTRADVGADIIVARALIFIMGNSRSSPGGNASQDISV